LLYHVVIVTFGLLLPFPVTLVTLHVWLRFVVVCVTHTFYLRCIAFTFGYVRYVRLLLVGYGLRSGFGCVFCAFTWLRLFCRCRLPFTLRYHGSFAFYVTGSLFTFTQLIVYSCTRLRLHVYTVTGSLFCCPLPRRLRLRYGCTFVTVCLHTPFPVTDTFVTLPHSRLRTARSFTTCWLLVLVYVTFAVWTRLRLRLRCYVTRCCGYPYVVTYLRFTFCYLRWFCSGLLWFVPHTPPHFTFLVLLHDSLPLLYVWLVYAFTGFAVPTLRWFPFTVVTRCRLFDCYYVRFAGYVTVTVARLPHTFAFALRLVVTRYVVTVG